MNCALERVTGGACVYLYCLQITTSDVGVLRLSAECWHGPDAYQLGVAWAGFACHSFQNCQGWLHVWICEIDKVWSYILVWHELKSMLAWDRIKACVSHQNVRVGSPVVFSFITGTTVAFFSRMAMSCNQIMQSSRPYKFGLSINLSSYLLNAKPGLQARVRQKTKTPIQVTSCCIYRGHTLVFTVLRSLGHSWSIPCRRGYQTGMVFSSPFSSPKWHPSPTCSIQSFSDIRQTGKQVNTLQRYNFITYTIFKHTRIC